MNFKWKGHQGSSGNSSLIVEVFLWERDNAIRHEHTHLMIHRDKTFTKIHESSVLSVSSNRPGRVAEVLERRSY